MTILHIVAVVVGISLSMAVLLSALQTVVLPRGGLTAITRFVFASVDRVFVRRHGLAARFGWEGFYAPVSLVALPLAWASVVTFGFALIFWGLDVGSLGDAMAVSGSSLFTLGFARPGPSGLVLLTFLEALIGLGLVALLISFLPTLYSAFSEREKGVALLRPLLGTPPSAVELTRRMHGGGALGMPAIWSSASAWFASLEQSHAAFPSLCSFPPQDGAGSWVVTAGTLLDTASLLRSALAEDDPERSPEFTLVLAHGIPAITLVASAAGLPISESRSLMEVMADAGPAPSVTISRAEFDAALADLEAIGLRMRPDADEAWRQFALLRRSYEDAVLGLAGLAHAPPAPWTSDRAYTVGRPHFFGSRSLRVVQPSS